LYSGLSMPHERGFSAPILSESMEELGEWLIEMVELALGTDIDMRLIEQNRQIDGLMGKVNKSHGESFSQAYCVYAAKPLNLGFDATNQPMWDDIALYGSHVTKAARTVNNVIPTTTVDWDLIWDMIDWLRISQYSQKDLRKSGSPKQFIGYPSLRRTMKKILGASGEPDTEFLNNPNTLDEFSVDWVECIELTDTGALYLQGTKSPANFVFKRRKPVTTVTDDQKRNRTRSILTHSLILIGVKDWDDTCAMQGT